MSSISVELQAATTSISIEIPFIIGGDGRADSPGQSAKYGSYGIIVFDLCTSSTYRVGTGILYIQMPSNTFIEQ